MKRSTFTGMAILFKLFLELYSYPGLLYMHVFIALIFIYDVFAFALSQILKILNLQSDVWYYTRILLVQRQQKKGCLHV